MPRRATGNVIFSKGSYFARVTIGPLPPRRFLEMVRDPRFGGRVLRIGRLRLVKREDLLAHLHALDEREGDVEEIEPDRAPASLVERLGLEEVPRRARAAHGGRRDG